MAHENAKKSARKNEFRLRLFILISVGISLLSAVIPLIFSTPNLSSPQLSETINFTSSQEDASMREHSKFSYTWFLFKLVFWAGHYVPTILLLKQLGRPDRSASGEIISCIDLSIPEQLGMYSYAQDIMWMCWVAHFMSSVVHSIFIILYLPIPGFALYKVFGSVIMPLYNAKTAMHTPVEQQEKRNVQHRKHIRRRE
eukprot:Tbor_TRINITY_DN5439_c1_g1::TRINITY_DN5439_c1_g1_i1::g.24357::m.24357